MELEEKLKVYRLSNEEYQGICNQLGREPVGVELALFSALWSEHCSYKSSKHHLKKLYSTSPRVLESFGENAGVIDLGEGERIAFKMESHNHPSFIEPFQGAATGVGGILRDIFTMGARPIALANYLCFGEPSAHRMLELVNGVVKGISFYGNCVGVPMVTGQTEFNKSYNKNILVNAFALGLFRPKEKIFTSKICGPKNYVIYVGAKTGRDGIHGASMASESFSDTPFVKNQDQAAKNLDKRPTVQIGDPFLEKLLIEACLEVMNCGLVEAIQDMGAAGLTSSSFEMSSKGGLGLSLHLERVPCREEGLTPEEILLSESQERMLIICKPENWPKLQEIFYKWNLDAVCIGEVRSEKNIQIFWKDKLICDIDPASLVDNAPEYKRDYDPWKPKYQVKASEKMLKESSFSLDRRQLLLQILSDVRGCSRDWIFNQYDQRVGASTVKGAESSVAALRLPDSGRGLGIVLSNRSYVMRIDACEGGKDSVAYPALELAVKGFEPLAVTDCLNFGNPEKKEIMSEFVASLQAMSAQCEALKAPIISGNVSLYNETQNQNITSTPTTGVVGLKPNIKINSDCFTDLNDVVLLVQSPQWHINGQVAELLKEDFKQKGSIDVQRVADFVLQLRQAVAFCKVNSSRVVGKFGRAYALAKMTLGGLGFRGSSDLLESTEDLFTEMNYEVLVAMKESEVKKFRDQIKDFKIFELGRVEGNELILNDIKVSVKEIKNNYFKGWGDQFESLA